MRFPVSFAQQRLWFLEQLTPGEPTYNLPYAFWLEGPLDARALQRAMDAMVARHAVLRTSIVGATACRSKSSPTPAQCRSSASSSRQGWTRRADSEGRVDRGRAWAPAVRSGHRAADPDGADRRRTRPAPVRSGHAPQHQRRIVDEDPDRRAVRRLPGRDGRRARVAAATVDGVRRLRRVAAGPHAGRRTRPAAELLARAAPRRAAATGAAHRPAQANPPVHPGRRGDDLCRRRDDPAPGHAGARRQRHHVHGVPHRLRGHAVALRAAGRPAGRHSGDRAAPTPSWTRSSACSRILSRCVCRWPTIRPLPSCSAGSGTPPWTGLAHEQLPFEKLVADLAPDRTLAHAPLIQVQFVYGSLMPPTLDLPGITTRSLALVTSTAKLDLAVYADAQMAQVTRLSMEYSADLFDAAWADRFLGCMATLLEHAADAPSTPVADLPMLSASRSAMS